ncbi:MAG: hypothetical protein R2864_08855 [Syntrophotaleaceae bacterium]
MRKIAAIIIGVAISLVLSYLGVALFLSPVIKTTGQSPESLMGYSYLLIFPVSLMVGSIVTGLILGQEFGGGLLRNAGYLPGLYASTPYAIGVFSAPNLVLLLLCAAFINIAMSSFGLVIGLRILAKKSSRET